ncbi:hypothetical protein GF354_05990 [Candidatus Peregrinibacteria bacterium]|nr:hypothetical protein [Candidatus Peregrinibacteria bacterium]
MIFGENLLDIVEDTFINEEKINYVEGLVSVSIELTKDTINNPGIYSGFLNLLAWGNISVTEMLSTFTSLTLIFGKNNIDRAFSFLIKEIS